MTADHTTRYRALAARDARFDGVFFVGVTSTGIYCRPICPARTPREANCRFFDSAEAAENASFRPCLRCRPELAPGNAPIDSVHRIAHSIGEDSGSLEDIARRFSLSSRQIRRIVQQELGVSPIELLQTRRLLLAKQLLTDTALSVTDIAFASGFSSLRRFNDAFSSRYRMPPSRLRKEAAAGRAGADDSSDTSTVQLTYRPPYDWNAILTFLKARIMEGVDHVTEDAYLRTVRIGKHKGWVRVDHAPDKRALRVEFTHSLTPVLPALLGRLRNLFDLGARPDVIAAHLAQDPALKPAIARNPGLRVPGAFDGFELAVRAILGQQVTVKAATTLSCRLAAAFGEKIATPFPELTRLAPVPDRLAKASVDSIAGLGIVGARAKCIVALSQQVAANRLQLDVGANPSGTVAQLTALPGIGQWTAQYISMRALRWPDAFPKEDIVVRKNLGGVTARRAEEMSQPWRPWRSYAVLHIWNNPPG